MFGTRSLSLTKPSALAKCHNLTFSPSLLYTQMFLQQMSDQK